MGGQQAVRSVTAQARRAQIVAATIDVIAEIGYQQASFARIAERAGLSSTRLISYHFVGKDELMSAVADGVITAIGEHLGQRLAGQVSAAAMLRAYIEGMVEFTAAHRAPMKALLEIFLHGGLHYDADTDRGVVGHVEMILRKGQSDGDFRAFDPLVVATAVQRAVEGLPFLLESTPELDVLAYGRELVTLFELGTRRTPA